jgi:hypothetical protein
MGGLFTHPVRVVVKRRGQVKNSLGFRIIYNVTAAEITKYYFAGGVRLAMQHRLEEHGYCG